jgi:Protein of unknown function (DUF3592)
MKFEYRSGGNDNDPLSNSMNSGYALPMPRGMARGICYLFLVTGLGFLGLATYLYFKQVEFMKTAIISRAQIMELIEDTGDIGKDDTTYRAILNFTAQDGKPYTVKSSVGYSRGLQSVGEQTEVIYAPGKPQEADLNSFFSNWISIILYVIGLVFFGLASVGLYLTHRRSP